ncbi:BID protein, partial [Eubucco bourcierii]|nr:BID protein [Eubucco bourcierii]
EVNNEAIRIIAARLVALGDRFDQEIKARVVNDLVQHFQNPNLPREDLQRVSEAVFVLLQAMPPDMEQEEAMLVLVTVLTKKIVNTVPSLLQRVFSAAVLYINQQLHNYVARLVSA